MKEARPPKGPGETQGRAGRAVASASTVVEPRPYDVAAALRELPERDRRRLSRYLARRESARQATEAMVRERPLGGGRRG